MTGPRIMQSQELATARPVMLPPGGETCDELVYFATSTPEVPYIATPAEHEALGPTALVAVTADGQWVWARAFSLPYEVQQRREREAMERAHAERLTAIANALADLHEQAAGKPWPGKLVRVEWRDLQAMGRAAKCGGQRRGDIEYRLQQWAQAHVDEAGHAR